MKETIDDLTERPFPTGVTVAFGGYTTMVVAGVTQVAVNATTGADVPGGEYMVGGGALVFFGGAFYHALNEHVFPWTKDKADGLLSYMAKH